MYDFNLRIIWPDRQERSLVQWIFIVWLHSSDKPWNIYNKHNNWVWLLYKKNENYTHIYTHTDIPHACESINANNYDKKKDLTKEEKYSVTFKRIYNVTHIIF